MHKLHNNGVRGTRYVHDAHSVGEAGALLPASHYNHRVASLDEVASLAKLEPELHPGIHILQPVRVAWLCNNITQK